MTRDGREQLEAAEGLLKRGTGGDAVGHVAPLNLTFAQWGDRAGGFVTHQGTLLRTERGVFGCGIDRYLPCRSQDAERLYR